MLFGVEVFMKENRIKEIKFRNSEHNYPSFSVLISVYKNEIPRYLDRSLKSILNQTVIPDEIILIEDGELPLSLEDVIKENKRAFPKKFKIIKLKKNQGLGNALRIGTKYVSTDWIARMDSDDISTSERFEKQLQEIVENKDLAVVGGQVDEFSFDVSNIVGKRKVPISYKEIINFAKWRSPFNHPTVMINKKALENVGGYIPFGNLEDYYLWARIIAAGYNVYNLPDVLVKMRIDNGIYARRGKIRNIKYIYALRNFLYEERIINSAEKYIGNFIMTINILLPQGVRKVFYQRILHNN